jgi:hypothetical protein
MQAGAAFGIARRLTETGGYLLPEAHARRAA